MARTFVVVGASTGLGRATVRALARKHHVIATARSSDPRCAPAPVPGALRTLPVDLADLRSVTSLVDQLAPFAPFAGVVCNAGVQHASASVFTRDGFEETFAVNHLGHFALALQLVPLLAPGARIAFVGSGTLDPSDRVARRFGFRGARYSDARSLARGDGDARDAGQLARDRYATSKLCNLLTMSAIARRVPASRFAAFAIDPGLMPGTGLARHRAAGVRVLWHTVMRVAGCFMPGASSARRSGAALAWLMSSPTLDGTTGRYFDFGRRERTTWYGADRTDWADELYATSLALCGIERDPLRAAA